MEVGLIATDHSVLRKGFHPEIRKKSRFVASQQRNTYAPKRGSLPGFIARIRQCAGVRKGGPAATADASDPL
jgi:hypothetical protein